MCSMRKVKLVFADIDSLAKNGLFYLWIYTVAHNDIDLADPKNSLQIKVKGDKIKKSDRLFEVDQHIDIAGIGRLVSGNGAKQRQRLHSVLASEFLLVLGKRY